MAAVSSFDQWQKDVFFSAAEEVQQSADLMESMYGTWLRDHSSGASSDVLDGLCRELRAALDTTKWQLEEFERAVSSSRDKHSSEETTIARRRQFIDAIENQVTHVGKALSNSLREDGKQAFHWVKLDAEERDDLVAFLSRAPQAFQEATAKDIESNSNSSPVRGTPVTKNVIEDTVVLERDASALVQEATRKNSRVESAGMCDWKIEIAADEEDADRKANCRRMEITNRASNSFGLPRRVESLLRFKWLRSSSSKAKREDLQLKHELPNYLDSRRVPLFAQLFNVSTERGRNCFSSWKQNSRLSNVQLSGRVSGLQRHVQFGRSLRTTLLLVLSIMLIVPFVLYSG